MYYGYTNFNLNRRMSQKRGAIETVIHWIGFTLKPGDPVSEKEVLQLLGMTELICCKSVSGRQGYRNAYFLKGTGITILTDGKSTMGTHVDIPGESIAALQNAICTRYQQTEETWLSYFLRLIISNDGAFTRIDLALDDITLHWMLCIDISSTARLYAGFVAVGGVRRRRAVRLSDLRLRSEIERVWSMSGFMTNKRKNRTTGMLRPPFNIL